MIPDAMGATPPLQFDPEEQEAKCAGEIRRAGGSLVLTIPVNIRDTLDVEEGQEVELAVPFDNDVLEVRPRRGEE